MTQMNWTDHLRSAAFAQALPGYLAERRWFRSKARTIAGTRVRDLIPLGTGDDAPQIALLDVRYTAGPAETYVLPLAFQRGEAPRATVLPVAGGAIYDPSTEQRFGSALLRLLAEQSSTAGAAGTLSASVAPRHTAALHAAATLTPRAVGVEQSNTSVIYGTQLILKLFRLLEAGTNPDLELGRFLTDVAGFQNTAQVLGALEYRPADGETQAVGILQRFVPNRGDAWGHTLDVLEGYFLRMTGLQPPPSPTGRTSAELLRLADGPVADDAELQVGVYLEEAHLLGQRTAEMHVALASAADDALAPAPLTGATLRQTVAQFRDQAARALALLDDKRATLPEQAARAASDVLAHHDAILARYDALAEHVPAAQITRIHGDYHLGQVLYTGRDFVIIDFEGEPARPLPERREKYSPLQDVAGMLRSFDYAVSSAVQRLRDSSLPPEVLAQCDGWGMYWLAWVSAAFLKGYTTAAGGVAFLPRERAEQAALLDGYTLNKAMYELSYELNNRPDWVQTPLEGIRGLLATTDRDV